jgi:hypothetical protein
MLLSLEDRNMKRMATVNGWMVAAAGVLATTAGCELVLGTDPNPRLIGQGGGGSGTTSTTGTTGSGGTPVCTPGAMTACYSGPQGTEGKGTCKGGTQTCEADGSGFGECAGEVTPQARTCAGTLDVACLGHDDCTQWAMLLGDLQDQTATSVAVSAKGDIVVAGRYSGTIPLPGGGTLTAPSGQRALFVIEFDAAGKVLWFQPSSPVAGQLHTTAVAIDANGNVVLAGHSSSVLTFGKGAIGPGLFLTKFDPGGSPLWTVGSPGTYSDTIGALAMAPNGDVLAAGHANNLDLGEGPTNSSGAFVARLRSSNGSGKVADGGWTKTLCAAPNACFAQGVGVDGAGNVFLSGSFSGSMSFGAGSALASVGDSDLFLGKLTPAGSPIWQKQIGGTGATLNAYALAVHPTAGVAVSGKLIGTADLGGGAVTAPASGDAFVATFGSDQSYRWSRLLVTGLLYGLGLDAAANVFLSGNFTGSLDLGGGPLVSPSGALFAAKLSSTGAFLWNRKYDAQAEAWGLSLTPAGEPVIVGDVLSGAVDLGTGKLTSAGGSDAFVVKLSP